MLCVRVSRFPSLEDAQAAPKCQSLGRPSPRKGQQCLWGGGGGGEGFPSWGKRSHAVRILTALHECSG
jgi:hypothetical protein